MAPLSVPTKATSLTALTGPKTLPENWRVQSRARGRVKGDYSDILVVALEVGSPMLEEAMIRLPTMAAEAKAPPKVLPGERWASQTRLPLFWSMA